jgi:ribonuclease ZC3H12
MLKNYAETLLVDRGGGQDEREHCITLPPTTYQALSKRRMDISSRVSAHIIWDNDNNSIMLLGSEESVQQTAIVLSQFLTGGGARKLVGRSSVRPALMREKATPTRERFTPSPDDAKNLLLMSQLPPELTISSPGLSQMGETKGSFSQFSGLPSNPLKHSPLGRTVSDSHTKLRQNDSFTRRKLESEDSSYDSDHENLAATLSFDTSNPLSHHQISKSHDDVSRTHSETLAQEFAEYVSVRPSYAPIYNFTSSTNQQPKLDLSEITNSSENLNIRSSGNSRDTSPVLSERLESVQETPLDCDFDLKTLEQDPQYFSKVEFALKLGYPVKLTQKALIKVGTSGGQDELLNELIRLQQSKIVDPKEVLLKETTELLKSTIPTSENQTQSSKIRSTLQESENLRPIVIDGSNVAMSHGNKETFSCKGIKICIDWFKSRGHEKITVFVPKWRKESSKPDAPIVSQNILLELEKDRILKFTPSRQVGGKRLICHDDRYILNLAAMDGAVVVSNDNYRELINEKPEFKKVIEERILMYTFVEDRFMPPDDPLGRNGPSLDNFLRIKAVPSEPRAPCPYGKKCTYGNKCKYLHVERGNTPHKSVTERLKEQSTKLIMEVRTRNTSRDSSPGEQLTRTKSMNLPLQRTESDMAAFARPKQPVSRTRSSRPSVNENIYHDSSMFRISKSEVSKSKSVEFQRDLRMSSVPIQSDEAWSNLEMGCLSNYGLQGPVQPPPGPWGSTQFSPLLPPPPSQQQEGNLHRQLTRQLTINPSFDPRINKEKMSPKHNQPILTNEAIEYMHRNPPPPLGILNISEQSLNHSDFSHQNVTRNASAPDSIRQWGSNCNPSITQPAVTPLGIGLGQAAPHTQMETTSPRSPMQRLNSTSDSQLNRGLSSVSRALSSDPFSSSETWKYNKFDAGISPLLGTSMTPSASIWGAPPSPPQLATPPPSPSRTSNLGPVGSRPSKGPENRRDLHYHLCHIFPSNAVSSVMSQMPDETDPKVLCAKIVEML